MPIETRFRDHLACHEQLIPAGSRVLVGLSGGPDSMALLHLLVDVRARLGLRLTAAHFDHDARDTSAAEARQVVRWAESLGVPCRVGRPSQPLRSAHADWRDARYAFLHSTAQSENCSRVATAHHQDDQVETVLFRLIRGTGTAGLAGIPSRRHTIVRPLLPFRRGELHAYVSKRGISHYRDPSNADPRWARARIRWQIRPALETRVRQAGGPPAAVAGALLRVAEQAGRLEAAFAVHDEQVLESVLVGAGEEAAAASLDLKRVRDLSPHDQARLIRRLARRLDTQLTAGGTRAAVEFISYCGSGASVDMGGGLTLHRSFDDLILGRDKACARPADKPLEIGREGEGTRTWTAGHRRFRVSWGTADRVSAPADYCIALPENPEHYPMKLRSWCPGDRIRTRFGTRKLKKVFGEYRVGVEARGSVPLLASQSGRILWAADFARDRDLVDAVGAPTKPHHTRQRLLRLSEEER
ncbi:MAG: tRNA lysidine(34) synthetase TilS [Gemmatimonadota bacterium]